MFRVTSFILLSLMLISCGASIDPALQSKLNTFFLTKTSKSFNASGSFLKPMPYTVGQYVVHAMTDGENKSVSKTSIVGKEQNGWIIETYSLTNKTETTTQMLITGLERVVETGNVDDLDIVWVKMKDKNGKIQTIEGPVLSITKGLYRKGLMSFNVKVNASSNGGNVSVPAGNFIGTIKTRTELSFFGQTHVADGWYHPSVPINGLVKSVSEDGKTVVELLDFDTQGASKTF